MTALDVAVREAIEETGLVDVRPWPDARLPHLAIAPMPASASEAAHEHAHVRFTAATQVPDAARPNTRLRPGAGRTR